MKSTKQSKSTATFPTEAKVVGKRYSIQHLDAIGMQGDCNNQKQVIRIEKGNALEQEQDTVLHELLHAVDYAMQTKLKEVQVAALATGLLAVMKENSVLMEYLLASSL